MISRGLFAIKFVVPALVLWQLGSLNCVEAKVHAAGASGMNTAAGANADVVTNTELTQLEQKLFERDYTTDLPPQRLERLEKMVFGKVGTGTETERIAALKAATITSPLEGNSTTAAGKDSSATVAANSFNETTKTKSSNIHRKHVPKAADKTANDENVGSDNVQSADQTQYPAVAAIEKKLFGKEYPGDSITSRLDRLELKQFGKVSSSDDLSERVDHLKQASGIDIAKRAPAGSDWADDDDLSFTDAPGVGKITPFTPDATGATEDGSNINNFIGNYGNGNGYLSGQQGAAGMGAMPHTTPLTAPLPPLHMGLNQEVTALEKEIFGKTYTKEALPERVNRLESAIFPDEKPAADKSLPDRVSRLMAVVPLSGGDATTADGEDGTTGKHGLKLSKMLGNMMGFTGAYPGTGSGNMSVDPQTGLLYNNSTGQLIDPSTGAVIGQRTVNNMGTMSPWGFGSGMSPYGTMPYGGFGMGGVGLGVGRMGIMGGYGGGGLW